MEVWIVFLKVIHLRLCFLGIFVGTTPEFPACAPWISRIFPWVLVVRNNHSHRQHVAEEVIFQALLSDKHKSRDIEVFIFIYSFIISLMHCYCLIGL